MAANHFLACLYSFDTQTLQTRLRLFADSQIAKVSTKEILIITVSSEYHQSISLLTLLRGQPQDG
jgi:hypothetical protein